MSNTLKLRDYQDEISDKAVQLLKKYKIAYLAMQVRTGKTLTAMATAHKFGAKSVLFVTKKKAISDIVNQFSDSNIEIGIYVTNFEQLANVKESFDLIIIDEAHSLAAFPLPSSRAKELKRICFGKPIIYLSGTPNPESFSQLYHQFWVSSYSPFDYHKTFYKWANDFVYIKKMMINGQSFNDYKKADEKKVMECCKHLFITYTQQEAGFESFVQETVHHVEMQESTYKFAERLRIDKIMTNKDGEVVLADTAVKLMQKLHQIFSGTVIVDEPTRLAKVFDYTKAKYIKEKFAGQKIAIYYKFIAEDMAIRYVFGSENLTNEATVFNESTNLVFISQIQSGREGVNISSADSLIFVNIDFSAVSYWQARARIQTKDRVKEANIHWIFAKGGIEDKIYEAVMNKKDYTTYHFKKDFNI
jgi:hypothetical protein